MPGALNLERFASISAELARSPSRDAVLQREGVSLEEWLDTQELWMTRMAGEARRQHFALSQRFSDLYAAHRAKFEEARAAPKPQPVRRPPQTIGRGVAAIPFAGQVAPPPPVAGPPVSSPAPSGPYTTRLSVQQLAALRAELTVTPELEHGKVRERFGLTEVTWSLEETYWQKQLKDPEIFARYLHVFKYYRGLLQSGSANG